MTIALLKQPARIGLCFGDDSCRRTPKHLDQRVAVAYD